MMLLNVVALLGTVQASFSTHNSAFRTPEQICSLIAASSVLFQPEAELLVDPTVFAHAVYKYKTILSKRFMWEVKITPHTPKDKISAFGSIPERNIKCTLAVTVAPQDNTHTTTQTVIEKRNTILAAILHRKCNRTTYPAEVLFGNATSLAELLSPQLCLQLLLSGSILPASITNTTSATADATENTDASGASLQCVEESTDGHLYIRNIRQGSIFEIRSRQQHT